MKFTKGIKKQFKEERDATFTKMRAEEDLQEDLRGQINRAKDDSELKLAKAKYDISTANWKQLNEHYLAYDALATKPKFKISPDTLLIVGGGLTEILLILNYEKFDIITSKALNYVLRKKV